MSLGQESGTNILDRTPKLRWAHKPTPVFRCSANDPAPSSGAQQANSPRRQVLSGVKMPGSGNGPLRRTRAGSSAATTAGRGPAPRSGLRLRLALELLRVRAAAVRVNVVGAVASDLRATAAAGGNRSGGDVEKIVVSELQFEETTHLVKQLGHCSDIQKAGGGIPGAGESASEMTLSSCEPSSDAMAPTGVSSMIRRSPRSESSPAGCQNGYVYCDIQSTISMRDQIAILPERSCTSLILSAR